MAAVNRKSSESKYVTCFADSRPDVDITFRDVLLSRPTDHYLVGVDNFSMTNTSLSMIEPKADVPLLRIVKVPSNGANVDVAGTPADVFARYGNAGGGLISDLLVGGNYDLSIKTTDVPILSVQQLMHQLGFLASDVNRIMNSGGVAAGTQLGGSMFGSYDSAAGETFEHLKFELSTDGRVTIVGSNAFWLCFAIEVPSLQNQFGFHGQRKTGEHVDHTRQRRFMQMNMIDKTLRFDRIQITTDRVVGQAVFNNNTILGAEPRYAAWNPVLNNIADFNIHSGADAKKLVSVRLPACIYSTLERRIALEVGCSLPIKNSPMVDHQKESPDFVLGRWIWRTDPRIESNDKGGARRYHSNMPACTEYQGAQDRITYHELQPQAKIQTLRIKLFARIRAFNEKDESWGMRVIELPSETTDWWHARLHFISKD